MRAYEREARRGVVEVGAGPVERGGPVARGVATVLRESAGKVRRAEGVVVFSLMAVPAGETGQAVVVIHVARRAQLRRVEAHQGETSGGVVEGGTVPIHRSVAARTILREVGRLDRKSTRLNSSHLGISYAVFCLK